MTGNARAPELEAEIIVLGLIYAAGLMALIAWMA